MDVASFISGLSQQARVLRCRFGGDEAPGDDVLVPYRLRLSWALSEPYTGWLICVSQSPSLELKSLLGRPAGVWIRQPEPDVGERCLTGLVDAVRLMGVDGGLAAYAIRIRPGLALLDQRRTSRVFQNLSVPEIVTSIVQEHIGANIALGASMQVMQTLRGQHPPRSMCTQYEESDLQFIHRLLAEEGISYSFNFKATQGELLHQWQLFDDAMDLPQAPLSRLGYRHSAGLNPVDALQSWQGQRQIITGKSTLASHDYKSAQLQQSCDISIIGQGRYGDEASASLEDYQPLTHYYASSRAELDRYARLRQQAHDLRAKTFFGGGTVTGLEVGQWFALDHHPAHADDREEQRQFLVTAQWLDVLSNPSAGLAETLPGDLAEVALPGEPLPSLAVTSMSEQAMHPGYSRFSAVRRGIALVPAWVDELARPTARGPLTGTVVGQAGDTVTTDELGRVKVQLRFPRAEEHPSHGADFDEHSSTWLRVMTPYAGQGFGHQFLPRLNDEVVVDFLYGDIDRPYVAGLLYGGSRPTPEFSGVRGLPGNRTLSGIQTREHDGIHSNELLFDDTPGQPRARLATTQSSTDLNLGLLTHPRRNGEAQVRGEGAELRTDASAAVRAAQGLLLSTYARRQADGHQLDRSELMTLLDECAELFRSLGDYAVQHGAQALDPAAQQTLKAALDSWPQDTETASGRPVMAFASNEGIVSATPQGHLAYAGTNLDNIAQQHLQLSSGLRTSVRAGDSIDLFAQSGDVNAIANHGRVLLQAQTSDLVGNAQQNVQLSAGAGEILLTAPMFRRVAEDGSFISVGEGITLGTSGAVAIKAASHDFSGPATVSAERPKFAQGNTDQRIQLHYPGHTLDSPRVAASRPYRITLDDGRIVEGVSDEHGRTEVVSDSLVRMAKVEILDPDRL